MKELLRLVNRKRTQYVLWVARILEVGTVLFTLLWAAEAYADQIRNPVDLRVPASTQEEKRLESSVSTVEQQKDKGKKAPHDPKDVDSVSHTLQSNPYYGETNREAFRF